MSDRDLPEGWARSSLASVAESIQYGYTASAEPEGSGPRFLRITDIRDAGVDWASVPGCSINADGIERYGLKARDIVFARSGATTGKSYLVRDCPPGAVFASYLIRVRTLAELADPLFLALFFQTSEYWEYITESLSGNAQPNCNGSKLAALPIPLPPLAEQRRIVEKVEELLAHVNAARDSLAKIPPILKRFRQSILSSACSGRLTEDWREEESSSDLPSAWRWSRLSDLLFPRGIFDGPFGSNLKTADYVSAGIRVVRLENIRKLQFLDDRKTYITEEKYQTLQKHTVREGDLIVASFIDEEVRACVLPRLDSVAIAKADCFCVRPIPETVDRHYLAYQIVSDESHERLLEHIHGATRPRVNLRQLGSLEVRLAPLPEQHEIVRRVEVLFAIADAIEERVAQASARADRLAQSILAKAFRGDLVPTEASLASTASRPYESAEELLARVQAEPAQANHPRRRGRRCTSLRSS